MNPVLVMVRDVIADESAQMALAQGDDMVENLSAGASYPALGDSVLPRRCDARALWLQTRVVQKCNHAGIEFRVVVEDRVAV